MKQTDRAYLRKTELAHVLGVHPRTITNWLAERRIPVIRAGKRLLLFDLEAVKAALRKFEVTEVTR